MASDEDVSITLIVSSRLGMYAAALASMEPAIDAAVRIVNEQREEDPESSTIPIMLDLLVAAKDMIKAHKTIERVAELMMTGSMTHVGPEKPQ